MTEQLKTQVRECLYDHANGKYQGDASKDQRDAVIEAIDGLIAECDNLTTQIGNCRAAAYKAQVEAQTLVEAAEAERDNLQHELSVIKEKHCYTKADLESQEPVGIVQAVSMSGTPMQDSRGVEWLASVSVGAKLFTVAGAKEQA